MKTSKNKIRLYMAGAMEKDKNMGAGWRNDLKNRTADVEHIEWRDPVELEPEKLSGCRVNRLPDGADSWIELKNFDLTHLLQRFDGYGNRIVLADMIEVLSADAVIVYRDATPTAGTLGEVTLARCFDIPVYVVCKKHGALESWFIWCTRRFDGGKLFKTFAELEMFLRNELIKELEDRKKRANHQRFKDMRKALAEILNNELKRA